MAEAHRGQIHERREDLDTDRMMVGIVLFIVLVAFVWFFFLGGAVVNPPLTVSGDDVSNQNQVQHHIRDNPPDNART